MTKQEFMNELRGRLYMLPASEREAALEYYSEYFDDAGPENERRVIEELGSPQVVAEQILSGVNERYIPPAYAPKIKTRKSRPWWIILIGVVLSPVLIPLAIAALALVLAGILVVAALAVVVVMLVVTLIVVVFVAVAALIVGGFLGVFDWIIGLGGMSLPFVSLPPGITGLGFALAALGAGLLLVGPCYWLFRTGIPRLARWIRNLIRKEPNG